MNRREFLRTAGLAAGALALPRGLWADAPVTTPAPTKRPNIVVILADDMGYSDIGCFGGEIQTPNIDRLAAGGMRFTQFYNCARCCPSRAALLTGLYPHQAGVGDMLQDWNLPAYQTALNNKCVTMAEVLRSAGYATAMSGKWHLGDKPGHTPTARGFEHFKGLLGGSRSYFKPALPSAPAGTLPAYATDAYTETALSFLDQMGKDTKPFFLYFAYTAQHYPVHGLTEDIAKYRGKYAAGPRALAKQRWQRQAEMGLVNPNWPYHPDELLPERNKHRPLVQTELDAAPRGSASPEEAMEIYAAQVDRLDQGVGRVVAKLTALGALDNTLILFLSDNGACQQPDAYGPAWATLSNTPFRRHKRWVHEGGISTPLVAHWPGGIPARGKLNNALGHITDIMPTVLEVSGAKYPAAAIHPLAGSSLGQLLRGGTRAEPEFLVWEHEGNRAIRAGKWKLVSAHDDHDRWELYDIEADRTENLNLADKEPDRVKQLVARYDEWAKQSNVVPFDEINKVTPKK